MASSSYSHILGQEGHGGQDVPASVTLRALTALRLLALFPLVVLAPVLAPLAGAPARVLPAMATSPAPDVAGRDPVLLFVVDGLSQERIERYTREPATMPVLAGL